MSKTKIRRCIGIFTVLSLLAVVSVTSHAQEFHVSGPLSRISVAEPRAPIDSWRVSPNNPTFNAGWDHLESNPNTNSRMHMNLELVSYEHITPTFVAMELLSAGMRGTLMLEQNSLVEYAEYVRQLRQQNANGYEQFRELLGVAASVASASIRVEKEARGSTVIDGQPRFVWVGIVSIGTIDTRDILAQAGFGQGGVNLGRVDPWQQNNDSGVSGTVDRALREHERLQRLRGIMDTMLH